MTNKIQLEPNLAPSDKVNLDTVQYPTYGSVKFDGVRAIIMDGVAYSRKFLPLHEVFQKRFKPFLDLTIGTEHVFDGEIFNPDATFTQITSSLANEDGVPLKLYAFDYMTKNGWYGQDSTQFWQFSERLLRLQQVLMAMPQDIVNDHAEFVVQKLCHNKEEVQAWLEEVMSGGGEGLMLRDPRQIYKHGRSTAKATPQKGGGFWKLKPFDTIDAVLIGYETMNRLTDEAKATIEDKDAFGRSKRGHRKGDREETNEIGKWICEVPGRTYIDDKGKEQPFIFKATWVKNSPLRTEVTVENFEEHKGRWVEVEYMSVGMKHLPRLPRAKRWRDDLTG